MARGVVRFPGVQDFLGRSGTGSPRFELLEIRQLLSIYYVTNTNDSGTGSLRGEIAAVNIDPLSNGQDIIEPEVSNLGADLLPRRHFLP